MKIGLVLYGSLDTISGGYLYDRMLVAHLRACGDEVEIISLPWQGYGRHLCHNFYPSLFRHLVNADFDLLLQDELNHPSLFWLNRRLKRQVAYPLISVVHHLRQSEQHPPGLRRLYRWVERRYLQTVGGFVFNSQTTRQVVEELVGIRPYVVAYPAGDRLQPALTSEAIVSRAQEPGPLRVLFVGNLIPRKGLHTLIAALCQLRAEEWQLNVVGSTAVDPGYTRRIKAGLPPNVLLHDALPDAQLAGMMQHSQVLAVPSQYEGFGIVYLEGMGFGLPAIGSHGGAAKEIISDGVDGFVVNGADTAVLAKRLRFLHQHRSVLAQMSLAAWQRFRAQPTWSESMAQVRAFLGEQVKG